MNRGYFSFSELESLWKHVVDASYKSGFEENEEAFVLWKQFFKVLEKVSQSIDRTTQSAYLCPYSGQTSEPAQGGKRASVMLSMERQFRLDEPLWLRKGTRIKEVQVDPTEAGGTSVETGRVFLLNNDVFLFPGEIGPLQVHASSETFSYGSNHPAPHSIRKIEQKGASYSNDKASIKVNSSADINNFLTVEVIAENQPDMFFSDHIGQPLLFTQGSNAGKLAFISSFFSPDVSLSQGSKVFLRTLWILQVESVTGPSASTPFLPNALVEISSVFQGRVLFSKTEGSRTKVAISVSNQTTLPTLGATLVNLSVLGQLGTLAAIYKAPIFTNETVILGAGGATWKVLSFEEDYGLVIKHETSPSDGKSAMLDEIGLERGITRLDQEPDEVYRKRVKEVADVVSPNAIRRTLIRLLGDFEFCFREVSSSLLPGFFYDTDYFYDNEIYQFKYGSITAPGFTVGDFVFFTDVLNPSFPPYDFAGYVVKHDIPNALIWVVRTKGRFPNLSSYPLPYGLKSSQGGSIALLDGALTFEHPLSKQNVYRVYFDFLRYRAYFLVSLQRLQFQDYGFFYGQIGLNPYQNNFYDVENSTFYDGVDIQSLEIYKNVYNALLKVKAAGVHFDLQVNQAC